MNKDESRTMKVWIFNHYTKPPSILDSHRHSSFARELVNRGHAVSVLFASTYRKGSHNMIEDRCSFKANEIEGVQYVAIKARNYHGNGKSRLLNMLDFYFGLFKVSKKMIKTEGKPDVIYASSVHPLTLVAGIRIAAKLGIACVCEVRDLWPLTLVELGKLHNDGLFTKVLYRGEKWIYKKADRIIFTMKGGREYVVDQGWDKEIDLSKITHINNGVDLELFRDNLRRYRFEDDDLQDKRTFKVIYAGSIGKANTVGTIVEAARALREKQDIKFLIYGDGLEKAALQEYVDREKLENIVFKGRVEKKYVPFILSNGTLNIFVGRPTKLYDYGISLNKMFDYFASGRPTVSNIRCSFDLLHEYNCGKTVNDNTPEALAEGILHFYNTDKATYKQYCDNSLKAAEDHDFQILGDKLEAALLTAQRSNISAKVGFLERLSSKWRQ